MDAKLWMGAALGAGLALAAPAHAATVTLSATLSGAAETKGGDADGSGSFTGEADGGNGDLCYTLAVKDIATATAAHIHSGAAGKDGPPVVTIVVTGPDDDVCVAVEPEKLKPILANPADYYVNVHNADYPAGAVRGQLAK